MCKQETQQAPATAETTSNAGGAGSKAEKMKVESKNPYSLYSIFVSKGAYQQVADEFHPWHKNDGNVIAHVFTSALGLWGVVQLALLLDLPEVVYAYIVLAGLTTPIVTAVLHSLLVYGMMFVPLPEIANLEPLYVSGLAVALGFGLQDVAHWAFCEKTYLGQYIYTRPYMLLLHSFWLMPLVIDAALKRHCFLPFLVNRNRVVWTQVANKSSVDALRTWVNSNIEETKVTTHVWPHKQEATSGPVKALEDDSGVLAGFREVFQSKHFDIRPVQDMNEIYVTAVGAKKDINSDAVFYTKHNDGPYWFLPFGSLYRVLVGITPNKMVRTRFNLQHETQDRVLDKYDVLGFDYSRELHFIDHVPGVTNDERRTLIKLHYVVYPKGWHSYGNLIARLNTNYNTWARNNFLQTLHIESAYDWLLAWWIWLTTIVNATAEEHVGWPNLVYVAICYALGPLPFLILTSFRHYCIYISTFAFRSPPVAHGFFMRDVLFFKTLAVSQLAYRLLPMVELPNDIPALLLVVSGFAVTMSATAQLGLVRTYFGSELGFVKPQWVSGFPYNTIPHPMIVGQLFAYSNVLFWFWDRMPIENVALVATHMSLYTIHMVQEMFTSSY